MADIRIKDLTTLASASLTGDVFVIDGTTGARKLSAFSPTFGGNATVTGTLTVNSTSPSVFSGTVQANAFHVPGNGASKPANTDSYLASTATTSIPLYVSGFTGGGQSADILRVSLNSSSDWFAVKGNGQVTCLATTASSSASSGALVVGNGTSGGLGVGGAIYTGNNVVSLGGQDFANASQTLAAIGAVSGAPRLTLVRSTSGLNNKYFDIVNNSDGQVSFRFVADDLQSATTALSLTKTNATVAAGLTVTTNLAVNGTTPSTSTSSGALVLSGGVGVGGSVNINNNLTLGYASAGDSVLKIIRSSGGNEWLQIAGWSAGSLGNNAYSIDAVNGASARPVYFRRSTDAGSTYTNFLTWDTSNNATFGGGVTISGGDIVRDGAAGAFRTYRVLSSNLGRWAWGADNASETGSNAGSNFVIYSFNDAGSVLTNPALRIDRASSNVLLAGDFLQSSSTNFNISSAGTNGNVYIKSNGGILYLNNTAGNGDIRLGNTGTVAYVIGTSASTSTSSGALVVSGGVGVAKRIHSGEGVTTGGDNDTHITFVRNGTVSIGPDNTATPALVVSSAIKTAAPSGGTAANWKLGTVATVSPTSPNRTIEVDIGGTIYYIHAKTTNN